MENIALYDFITFDVDFVGVRFLFQNSFHSFLSTEKNMTFMNLEDPTDHKPRGKTNINLTLQ